MIMDLTNIRTFLKVVESGNFARAAQELQYAQSTVTAQIQALERELGFPLFERIGRKNHLTNEGMEFLRYANELQYTLQKISGIGQQSDDAHFTLRVGVAQSLLFDALLEVIPLFRQKYPHVLIALKTGNTLELQDMLRQNKLDLIYISAPPNIDPALSRLYLRKTDVAFVSGLHHPLAGHGQLSLDTVLRYPFVLNDPTGQSYAIFQNLVTSTGLNFQCSITVNDNSAITAFLQDQHSVSLLPRPAISQGNLAVLDVAIPPQAYYSQILVRKNTWISPAIVHLLSLIRQFRPENRETAL